MGGQGGLLDVEEGLFFSVVFCLTWFFFAGGKSDEPGMSNSHSDQPIHCG